MNVSLCLLVRKTDETRLGEVVVSSYGFLNTIDVHYHKTARIYKRPLLVNSRL